MPMGGSGRVSGPLRGCSGVQGLSQDIENWEPKIGNFKISGHPMFQGTPQYTQSGYRLFGYRLG